MLFIWGWRRTIIGVDEILLNCKSCEAYNLADIMVYSKFYHFFWIPLFPYEKQANIVCTKCGLRRYNVPVDKEIFSNYEEIKSKFRHPWFTYIGLVLFIILLLTIVFDIAKV